MNRSILTELFPELLGKVDAGLCPICEKAVTIGDLRDRISRAEFKISGLCQGCQDKTFGGIIDE
ncbi:MAG: hypothetical protein DRJ03_04740 [Chloroflexi bacterium]|nr:MAG: hypothetical protein DRJ03_04740 [Chloroflexota bacterium]